MKLLAGQIQAADGGAGPVGALDTYHDGREHPGSIGMPNGTPYDRVVPGDAAPSLIPLMALSQRHGRRLFSRLPPLVSHVPDTDGEAPLSAWINALGDAGP